MRETLGLLEHPEGGWFRETWRSPDVIETPRGPRSAVTSILYLLAEGQPGAWHRVIGSREMWQWQGGGTLELRLACYAGAPAGPQAVTLGPPPAAASFAFAEPGQWQQAEAVSGDWALMACTVSPGFDFADFEML